MLYICSALTNIYTQDLFSSEVDRKLLSSLESEAQRCEPRVGQLLLRLRILKASWGKLTYQYGGRVKR